MVVPQSKPSSSGKILGAPDRDFSPENSSSRSGNLSGNLDDSEVLSSLKELIAAGDHRLDTMLGTIADAARQLTGASGAALAMWKDGAMVCRARSGDTAPALGARLSANTGISGECLRSGKIQHCTETENNPLVDVEVCRSLGLRSIAVLPIPGWRGISGILEVFSTEPAAFTESHIALLEQLAALAERARATQPHDASPAAPKVPSAMIPSAMEKARPSGFLPASDRVGDVALAFLGSRSRALVFGAIGLVALSLLVLAIWLGWRGPDEAESKSHAATPVAATVNTVTARPGERLSADRYSADKQSPGRHPLDNDPVWKENPGGETLFLSVGKPSAGAPVEFASKVDVIAGKKTVVHRSPLLADLAGKVAANSSIAPTPRDAPNLQTGLPADSQAGEPASAEPPSIPVRVTSPPSSSPVLSAKESLPSFAAPVSTGVSGGQLVHRVEPVYPDRAILLHVQGTVILAAMVMEDGKVGDVKVVEGSQELAPSAVRAVKRWRYKPFALDGKPVKNEVRISVDFKSPFDADSH